MISIEYVGKDLEAMHFAVAYLRWILDLIIPYLGRRIVEVGAGSGSFSEMLSELDPESLFLIEPSEMFHELQRRLRENHRTSVVGFFNNVFSEVAEEIGRTGHPDSILYINVLEHIHDDVAELSCAHTVLEKGGRIFVFVPALPMLFSDFDRSIGHFRRYNRAELERKVESAGFNILDLRWFDMPGIIPWLIKYRLLGSKSMEALGVRAYDRLAVPLIRRLERLIHPPVGKNLLLIAEKG